MSRAKRALRRIGRWSLRLLAALLVLAALDVTVLAFPQLLVRHSCRAGTVIIYHDTPIDDNIRALAARVESRLRASGLYDSTRTDRVFLLESEKTYAFFARLSWLPNVPQGYNLSVFHNSFVSAARSRRLAEWTGGLPLYSIWDGDLSHLIAHEIAHQYVMDRIGRSRWKSLPHWKQEGLPEYIANIGLIRADTAATMARRMGVLRDDQVWLTTQRPDGRQGWDRIHYAAGLMVEFLIEQEGLSIDQLIADSVDGAGVRQRMALWFSEQTQQP